jgi:hypothetical protein
MLYPSTIFYYCQLIRIDLTLIFKKVKFWLNILNLIEISLLFILFLMHLKSQKMEERFHIVTNHLNLFSEFLTSKSTLEFVTTAIDSSDMQTSNWNNYVYRKYAPAVLTEKICRAMCIFDHLNAQERNSPKLWNICHLFWAVYWFTDGIALCRDRICHLCWKLFWYIHRYKWWQLS